MNPKLIRLVFAHLGKQLLNESTRANALNALACVEFILTCDKAAQDHNLNKAAQWLFGSSPPNGWKVTDDWKYVESNTPSGENGALCNVWVEWDGEHIKIFTMNDVLLATPKTLADAGTIANTCKWHVSNPEVFPIGYQNRLKY